MKTQNSIWNSTRKSGFIARKNPQVCARECVSLSNKTSVQEKKRRERNKKY